MEEAGMSPDPEDKPAASPLDVEREVLRKAGYTDAEVSQILVARAASQQPAGAAGQGVMSNVLSSIVAVGSHARALIPTFRKDVMTVFDGAATASARAGAATSLAVKAVVIMVLGYAAWQEWQIHIVYATQTAAAQAAKAAADAAGAQWQTAKWKNPWNLADERSQTQTPPVPATAQTEGQKCLRKYHDRLEQLGWNFAEDSNPADFADTPENAQRCFDESKKTCQAKFNGKLITAEQLQNCLTHYFSPQRDWHSG
jgi:hypothetical protein